MQIQVLPNLFPRCQKYSQRLRQCYHQLYDKKRCQKPQPFIRLEQKLFSFCQKALQGNRSFPCMCPYVNNHKPGSKRKQVRNHALWQLLDPVPFVLSVFMQGIRSKNTTYQHKQWHLHRFDHIINIRICLIQPV